MKEIITEAHEKYARECLKAAESWPERHLSVKDMRDQVKRIHEAVWAEKEKSLTSHQK